MGLRNLGGKEFEVKLWETLHWGLGSKFNKILINYFSYNIYYLFSSNS